MDLAAVYKIINDKYQDQQEKYNQITDIIFIMNNLTDNKDLILITLLQFLPLDEQQLFIKNNTTAYMLDEINSFNSNISKKKCISSKIGCYLNASEDILMIKLVEFLVSIIKIDDKNNTEITKYLSDIDYYIFVLKYNNKLNDNHLIVTTLIEEKINKYNKNISKLERK